MTYSTQKNVFGEYVVQDAVLGEKENYRLVVRYDQDVEFDNLIDWEHLGIVRAYSWQRRDWGLICGKRDGRKAEYTKEFSGYSQGEVLRVHYNKAQEYTEDGLEEFANIWRGEVYVASIYRWNPTPNHGWELEDSIGGVLFANPHSALGDPESMVAAVKELGYFDDKILDLGVSPS